MNNVEMCDFDLLVLNAIEAVLVVYVACTLIAFTYIRLIKRPLLNKHWDKMSIHFKTREMKIIKN